MLHGRHALITGASSGIGRATAIRLAADGATVAVNYHSPSEQEDADQLISQIRTAGGTAIAVQADVGNEEDVKRMVATTVTEVGGLDLLVNNAGIEKQVPLLQMSLDDWESVIRTNLTGAFLCLREAGAVMAETGAGGVIVNMSSVHEFIPWAGYAHYCATKGGIKLLMQTAARELAEHHIRVVSVAPGAIVSPINQSVLDDPDAKQAVEDEIPLGRIGSPEEVAAAVAWLASDQADYVTGTTLVVDGGMSLYPKFV